LHNAVVGYSHGRNQDEGKGDDNRINFWSVGNVFLFQLFGRIYGKRIGTKVLIEGRIVGRIDSIGASKGFKASVVNIAVSLEIGLESIDLIGKGLTTRILDDTNYALGIRR
jgi:hypothetical protein